MSDPRRRVVYADTSALLKLVVREAESSALELELVSWPALATSTITSIELRRAVMRARLDERDSVADDATVDGVLSAIAEIPLTNRVRDTASSLTPVNLRALDAIHLASALALGNDLAAVLTYDSRLRAAAEGHELGVLSPG